MKVHVVIDWENQSVEGVYKTDEEAMTRVREMTADSNMEADDMSDDEVLQGFDGTVTVEEAEVAEEEAE